MDKIIHLQSNLIKMANWQLVLFIIISVGLYQCSTKSGSEKIELLRTQTLDESIYAEYFRVDSYGIGGDVYSVYITDSVKFRLFVFLYYDRENVDFEIKGDEIHVIKTEDKWQVNGEESAKKIVDKQVYSVNELRKEGNYE